MIITQGDLRSIRILVISLSLLLSLNLVACDKSPFNPEYEQSAYGLGISVRANQAYYEYGNPIDFTFTVVNLTDKKKDLTTPDSRLYDLKILNQNNEHIWQFGYVFGGLTLEFPFQLMAHQQKTYTVTCEDTLAAGQYAAIGWFNFIPSLKDTTGFIILDGGGE